VGTSPWLILLLAGVGALGLLSFFYSAACVLLRNLEVHDLAVRAHTLRNTQLKRLAELRGSDAWEDAELVMNPGVEEALDGIGAEAQPELKKAA
jgi:hypothetical protein